MSAASRCYACEIDRDSIDVFAIADGYDLRSYKCPGCGSIFKLVTRITGLDAVQDRRRLVELG